MESMQSTGLSEQPHDDMQEDADGVPPDLTGCCGKEGPA
jgi:hypothetical protein